MAQLDQEIVPAGGLDHALEVAAETAWPALEDVVADLPGWFAEGVPPGQAETTGWAETSGAGALLAALPESLEAGLEALLRAEPNQHALDAPGSAIAAEHFPHADFSSSLPPEILFASADV